MHFVQKNILDSLRKSGEVRYVQLNSYKIESSHFRYHLEQLLKDGFVKKVRRGTYALTDEGSTYVDKLSEGRKNPHTMPKVITYTLLSDDENLYLQRKDKEPYKYLLNMIGGKVHEGETSEEASIRELLEKVKFSAATVSLVGVYEIQTYKKDKLYTHVIAFVYKAKVRQSDIIQQVESIHISEINKQKDLAPDFLAIYENISGSKVPEYQSIKINLDR